MKNLSQKLSSDSVEEILSWLQAMLQETSMSSVLIVIFYLILGE